MKYSLGVFIQSALAVAAATPVDTCAQQCNDQLAKCKADHNANQSTCITQYSGCIGYDWAAGDRQYATACSKSVTTTPTATADACAQQCNAQLAKCKADPNANQSTCIAEYSGCIGYDWASGNRQYATACSQVASTATVSSSAAQSATQSAIQSATQSTSSSASSSASSTAQVVSTAAAFNLQPAGSLAVLVAAALI